MLEERIYYPNDLRYGKCSCCGQESSEIAKYDTRCVDCIEMQLFEDETRRAIDMGGGCSRCGDLSGFECICDDDFE